jgi:CHAT domain-containing protein
MERSEILWRSYLGIGDSFERMGKLDSARVYNRRAVDVLEEFRGQSLSEEARTSFLGNWFYLYEAQIHVLGKLHAQTGDPALAEEAFAVAERGKSRALLDMLAESQVDLSTGLPSEVVEERAEMERRLSEMRYRVRKAEGEEVSADSLRALRKHLRELEGEQRALLDRIRLENPKYAALDSGEPRTLEEIRRNLVTEGDRALFQFTLGDSASYLWVLTAKNLDFHRLPPRPEIESQVQRLRTGLTNPLPSADAELVDAASTLYAMLFKPAEERLKKAKSVYIIPDGSLHFIPFEVLLEEPAPPPSPEASESDRNRVFAGLPYAFKKTNVRYGPSATALSTLALSRHSERKKKDRTLLAVGSPSFGEGEGADAEEKARRAGLAPLPYTRDEIETIGSHFKEANRTLLLDAAAREKTLTEPGFLSRFDMLHFATHGLIDERRPEKSRLALSFPRDPSEDGYLQASEIYELDLGADLVVLSACETGLGKMVRGEGVLGLPRAFLYAGASSIVVSLWSVSDRSTADLMSEFYRRMMGKNDSPAEALRRAKEELRKSGAFAHPFYWAPFVILGPEPVSG